MSLSSSRPFGVYIHIPFCRHRCDYCAFATWTDRDHVIDDYLDAVRVDISRAALDPVSSVFVGGGTPTRVPAADLASVIAVIPLAPAAEVTVECNPDDVTRRDDGDVRRRRSEPRQYRRAIDGAIGARLAWAAPTCRPTCLRPSRRFVLPACATFNLDIIYGGAGETLDDWQATLEGVLALRPPHVSAYALTIEAGTPLAEDPSRHPDDDDLADKYELADDLLSGAGLANYEVSNWAIPGHECRHNILYWQQGNYRGFGSAAHSHDDGHRWWNVRTPERYVAAVRDGESTEAAGENLDDETRRIEGLQLALRMKDGVPSSALNLEGLEGLITDDGDRVRLTRHGRLLANEVSLRLR